MEEGTPAADDEASFAAGGHVFEIARAAGDWPDAATLSDWSRPALAAAAERTGPGERGTVAILFTDDAAVRALNASFRDKDRPTNVLSFPAAAPNISEQERHLGDIVLAAETVAAEAAEQGKTLRDHVVHLVLHGFLHLLGYDHADERSAHEMERVERETLAAVGIADPYAEA